MHNLFYISFFAASISFLISYFSVPLIIKSSKYFNSIDRNELRTVELLKVPRLGGLGIFLGMSITLLIIIFSANNFSILENKEFNLSLYLIFSITFFLLGFFDDFKPLSPIFRLFFQLTVSSSIWLSGIGIKAIDFSFINGNFSEFMIPSFFSLILTLLWVSGIVNAINWIDGIDGLAISFSIINFFFLFIICFLNNHIELAIISSTLFGACLGFLPKNIRPAKIYMGDGGAYLLGFNLALLSMLSTTYNSGLGDSFSFITIKPEITLLILSIPVLDMCIVIFLRLINRDSPVSPDRKHLHHRLKRIGFKTNEVVFLISSLAAFNSSLALIFLNIKYGKFLIMISLISIILIIFKRKKS